MLAKHFLISVAMLGSAAQASEAPTVFVNEANRAAFQFYPRDSLKTGEEGAVVFRVETDSRGKLLSCVIARSSGYKRLDEATCIMLTGNASFDPLQRPDGLRSAGVREGTVLWVLPASAPGYGKTPRQTQTVASLGSTERIICRRQTKKGSMFLMEKVCLSASDWKRQAHHARDEVTEMQTPKGTLPQ